MTKIDFKNYGQPVTNDYSIPEAGIEDIDRAIFKLFDKDISFETLTNNELSKVPVVFASGERFALTRRKNPIRDDNNTIILPIIAISRGGVDFSNSQNGRGSAITTRDQDGYIIKKRLSEKDREYQNLINKFGIKNQDNVSSRNNFSTQEVSPGKHSLPGTVATRRQTNALRYSKSGGLINLSNNNLGENLFEIIQVPYPVFITIDYQVTFWTQYMSQMNEIQETFLTSMLGQSEEFVILSDKGYEYVAKSGTSFQSNFNFDNYTESERIIKSSIDFKVTGYLLNTQNPGMPNQIRSFLSAPNIEFGYHDASSQIVKNNTGLDNSRNLDKFILSDIQSEEEANRNNDDTGVQEIIINPFSNKEIVSFSKILTKDQRSGETVASNMIIKKIETQYE
jgi:hypothetical protein